MIDVKHGKNLTWQEVSVFIQAKNQHGHQVWHLSLVCLGRTNTLLGGIIRCLSPFPLVSTLIVRAPISADYIVSFMVMSLLGLMLKPAS